MSESTEKGKDKDAVSQWLEWQTRLYQGLMENAKKNLESAWGMGAAPGTVPAFGELGRKWMKAWEQLLGPGGQAEGLGATVMSRVQEAAGIYTELLGFWSSAMQSLARLPAGASLNGDKLKELSERLTKEYQKVLTAMWGAVPSPEIQETVKSFTSAQDAFSSYMRQFLGPVFKNLEQAPALFQKLLSGDQTALLEFTGLFRKNYEATVGKALRTPSLGYFRELVERINRTLDAALEFNVALGEYQALFFQTSQRAGEKIVSRLSEFKEQEITEESFREFYRLWWTINEETFQELFHSPEFTRLLKEVLVRGLLFRKWLDDLGGQFAELVNLPTKNDMDEIYKALYELRKEVRWQRRALRRLEEELGVEAMKESPTE